MMQVLPIEPSPTITNFTGITSAIRIELLLRIFSWRDRRWVVVVVMGVGGGREWIGQI